MTEPNDYNLPLSSGLYWTILQSFNGQGRLVVGGEWLTTSRESRSSRNQFRDDRDTDGKAG